MFEGSVAGWRADNESRRETLLPFRGFSQGRTDGRNHPRRFGVKSREYAKKRSGERIKSVHMNETGGRDLRIS
jgi:hypothetical protein